jgi:hypothetical protein
VRERSDREWERLSAILSGEVRAVALEMLFDERMQQ